MSCGSLTSLYMTQPPAPPMPSLWSHRTSRLFPSRTSLISLASSVSYISRASARFLCSLA